MKLHVPSLSNFDVSLEKDYMLGIIVDCKCSRVIFRNCMYFPYLIHCHTSILGQI